MTTATTAQGLSIAVGRYQASRGSDSQTPLVATASNGWNLGSRSTLSAGALISAPYGALAFTFAASGGAGRMPHGAARENRLIAIRIFRSQGMRQPYRPQRGAKR